jgi:hypothetical protein
LNKTFHTGAGVFLIVLCLLAPSASYSQGQEKLQETTRKVQAVRAAAVIKIDGRLDEPAWADAAPAAGFLQQNPNEGAPASEKTEVRVLFDGKFIYFGIRAFDSEAQKINARELTRDADFANDDSISIILDTNHDRRNAFLFVVNPLGTQQDGYITDEGHTTNYSWDAPWFSAATIDTEGFTIEIALPLMSLRFDNKATVWGFNVARMIRRKNEMSLWTSWQRMFGLQRVSQAGELTGVEGIHRPRLLEFKPYGTAGYRQNASIVGSEGLVSGAIHTGGLEVGRIGITPSLTAELTVNPDFGQVEVDEQVVNLSRFSVFFPEKRDFFLENAGVFLMGREESNQLFFTRRIGLTDDGQPLPIDYGAKLTGRIGAYNVGFLQVGTREVGDLTSDSGIPRQQYTVARVKRDVFGRSSVGAMFVNREGGVETPYNRAAGIDALINLTDHWQVISFLMGTGTPGVRSSFLSGRVGSYFEDDRFRVTAVYEDIGTNFNPEVGFVERTGIRQYYGQFAYKPRPRFLPFVRQMQFETQCEYYENRGGKLETRQTEVTWETEFQNSTQVNARILEKVTDVLAKPFKIRPGITIPAGTYTFNRPWLSFSSDKSKRLGFSARAKWGDFYSGDRFETSGSIVARPNEHFNMELNESYNRVRLPEGDFSTNLFGGRATFNFSRKWLSAAFIQFNQAARLSSVNLRLRYIFRPNSDLFVIYNQTTGRGLEQSSYQFQVKLTYNFTWNQ